MAVEAELKAQVRDVEEVRRRLAERADVEFAVYRDTYYDRPSRELTAEGRELRVRTVERDGESTVVLTFKEPAVDEASGSKPEHETTVADAAVLDAALRALGAEHLVSLVKHCENYRFTAEGRDCLATLLTVPELDGTFIEVETIVEDGAVDEGLAVVRRVLDGLGIGAGDLTTEQYTAAVMARRG